MSPTRRVARSACTRHYYVAGSAVGRETCVASDAVFPKHTYACFANDSGYLLVWAVRQIGGAFNQNLFAQRFNADGFSVHALQQINSIR